MNKYNVEHSVLISQALNVFPPSLQAVVLSDSNFCKANNISTDAQVTLENTGVSFSRSALFQKIRETYSGSSNSKVSDSNNDEWVVSIAIEDKSLICIERSETKIKINSFWPLIDDIDLRKSIFEKEAKLRNMDRDDIKKWMSILSQEKLDDDDVWRISSDLELTPFSIENLLRAELSDGINKIKSLAPDGIRYYERLIGIYSESSDINNYAVNELSHHFNNRVNGECSFLDANLCSHSAISDSISAYISNQDEYLAYAKSAIQSKNPIAIMGCFEIGISRFIKSNESLLQELFEYLCDPEILKTLTLLSSMTIFVDGELARLNIFKNRPSFYRRLASISQASLITNIVLEQGIEFADIEKWAMEERGLLFYCQTFIDMREEPRWLPGYLSAEQFRNELLGRVYNICQRHKEFELCKGLLDQLTSHSFFQFNSFLPGPLEGNTEPGELPDYIKNKLDESIKKQMSLVEFGSLINSAQYWKVDDKYVQHAIMLLDISQHQLREAPTKESIFAMLNGLAKVSALTRSKKLATSVMILSRIYRDYLNVNSEPEHILGMGLVASAAFSDKEEWAEYIGQWLTELAYLPLEASAISSLRSMLEQLCVLEPFLYYTCGRPLEILKCLEQQ
jgi:hypothetical protein